MANILDHRDEPTDAERAAVDVPARRGIALYDGPDYLLSQDETDILIVAELHTYTSLSQTGELTALTHAPRTVHFIRPDYQKLAMSQPLTPQSPAPGVRAFAQRGGISTDPLVRLLAFRAWGSRDQEWNEPLPSLARSFGIEQIRQTKEARGTLLEARRGGYWASVIIPPNAANSAKDPVSLLIEAVRTLADKFDRENIKPEGKGTR